MGRKNKYETHVKPYLDKIAFWYQTMTEAQIAARLGICVDSFEKYKREHEELTDCLRNSKQQLISDLKETLKKKAKGYEYEETKTTIRQENDKEVKVIEKYKKYAHPDTAAIHLLLKNLDDSWRNDDKSTMEIKREQTDIAKKRAENAEW